MKGRNLISIMKRSSFLELSRKEVVCYLLLVILKRLPTCPDFLLLILEGRASLFQAVVKITNGL